METVGPGQRREVGRDHRGARHTRRVVAFLMGTDRAVDAVVQDQHHGLRPGLRGGGQFLAGHLEIAVPGKTDDGAAGVRDLGRDGRRKPVSHGPGLRRQQALCPAVAEEIARPHSEVPRPVGQDRVVRQDLRQMCHDLAHVHRRGLLRQLEPRLEGRPRLCPPGAVARPQRTRRHQRLRKGGRVGMDAQRGAVDLAQFAVAAMHVDQRLFRVRHLQQRVAPGGIFPESQVDSEDDVGFLDQLPGGGPHAHTGMSAERRRVVVKHVEIAEDGHGGDVVLLRETAQRGLAGLRPVASSKEQKRPFRALQDLARPGHRRAGGRRRQDLDRA